MTTPQTRTQAIQEILKHLTPLTGTATPPEEAEGRVAAENVTAACNVPEHACSVRDGYALKVSDIEKARSMKPVRLKVNQCIRAESRDPEPIQAGEAARVLTGGPVPPGADAVLAEEDIEQDGDTILVTTPVRSGWFVRAAGGEIAHGTTITPKGTVISPQAAAVMTRTRLTTIMTHPRPAVSILALGSELAVPGTTDPDRFPADNLVLSRGLLEHSGAAVIRTDVLPDKESTLIETLSADDLPDVVITSGGTGRSERDFARMGAGESGFTILVDRVNMRPGRNMFVAQRDQTLLFGLPGPPAAVFTCFHAIILPVIRHLRGLPAAPPVMARFTKPLNAKPGSEWLVQCELALAGSQLTATPLAGKDVPPMLGMAKALGMALLHGGDTIDAGDEVEILTTAY
ncbi:molybdopterin molybdotransferase MoeA [Pseudodesulfovibrio sediminis]|nr:molybdopterin molybdotransferase MoeA [Pseudodesulfovibrio sediminis]